VGTLYGQHFHAKYKKLWENVSVTWLENARGLASSLVGSEIRQTMKKEREK